MEAGEIREPAAVIVLPPTEGYAPKAIGAVGMMVRLLAGPDDIVVGQNAGPDAFTHPPLIPVRSAAWTWRGPLWSRTGRYLEGATRTARRLRPTLIEVHNRANLALQLARAMPHTPVTLFLHNDPQSMRMAGTAVQRATLLRHMEVVCVSAYLQSRFMDGLTGAGPRILPNAIDLAALPTKLPPDARDRLFLFAGRIVADKGADAFVRAFAAISSQLPGWRAAMIGADRFTPHSPETPFIQALRPAAAQAGIDWRGYQTHDQVLAAMARAAIVIVPSRWQEPFGLTALEAMASGAALICAPAGGLPEVASNAARFAPPDPPGALEHAMLSLARDPPARTALATAGLARAQHFDAPAARIRLLALRRERVRSGSG